MRRVTYWVGTTLLALGIVVLLLAGGLYAYGLYDDMQYDSSLATETPQTDVGLPPADLPTETPTAAPAPSPAPDVTSTPEAVETSAPGATATATAVPTTPTSTPALVQQSSATAIASDPQPAVRIKAPSIKLDAPVRESVIKNGQWVVPKFAAGHLQGTGQPGEPGNSVYAGHVSSISSGDVFANIGKLSPGDSVALVIKDGQQLHYRVTSRVVVKNTDLTVTHDKGDERVTLITCTGTWLPLQHDFNQRMVVFASRVD